MSNPNEVSNVESQENISDGISNSSSGSSGISSYLQTPHPEPQLSSNSHSDHDHPHSHDSPPQHHHHPVFINRRILCVDDVYCTSQVPKSSSRPKSSKLCSSTSRVLKGFLPSSFTRCPPSPWSLLTTLLPITGWLRTYRVREDLLADVITGVTILALHIPQGLAYGRLAGVEPINGLYVSLFPVVVYALFGGSRQISIGTFAVISIACRDVLDQVMATNMVDGEANLEPNQPVLVANLPTSISSFVSSFGGGGGGGDKQALAEPAAMAAVAEVTAIEVLTSLCLLVGIIQFVLGLLRLGIVATLLSEPIISAFCVAAAIHVFTSQVFALVDVDSAERPGEPDIPFDVIKLLHMHSSAVHGTRRRGLAPLDYCKLPLPRGSREKRAGPEASETYCSQAMSVAGARLRIATLVHGGSQLRTQLWSSQLWSGSLVLSHVRQVLVTLSLSARAAILPSTLGHHFIQGSSFHGSLRSIFGPHGVISGPSPGHGLVSENHGLSWYRLGSRITTGNLATAIISACTMAVLYGVKDHLEPYLKRRFRLRSLAIPVEIISIVFLTGLSYAFDLNSRFQVSMIPKIAAGFDGLPVVLRFDLWPKLATSALLLAFICYASTYSLEKLYAAKHGYEVAPNQELLAMGVANSVSSFFGCYPCAGSLARSAVQDKFLETLPKTTTEP
ncbi:hypothetical protein TYRP_009720 [Tyrophagus putrescentiae]|nr:hypothetical protein TYRP_009720 [Tyrophagus putrescentiae]